MARPIKTLSKSIKGKNETLITFDALYELSPMVSHMVSVQYYSGLRMSDVRSLKVSQVMQKFGYRSEFVVYQKKLYNAIMTKMNNGKGTNAKYLSWSEAEKVAKAKEGSKVTVLVTSKLAEQFEQILEYQKFNPYFDGELMFASSHPRGNGKAVSLEYVNRLLKSQELHDILKKHEIPTHELGTHSFRKSAAQRILEGGGTLMDVKETLGHRSLTSTQKYLASDDQKRRSLLEDL